MRSFFLFFFCIALVQAQDRAVADSLYQLGNYRAAINAYSELGTPQASLQIARAYKASGMNSKSVEQYKALVEQYPEQRIARFELGKLYFQLYRLPAAAAIFQQLFKEDSNNPEYAYYLGRTYHAQDSYKPAIQEYGNALKADSTHVRSLFQLAKVYLALQEHDSVLKYTAKGLAVADKDGGLTSLRAQAFYNQTEYDKAIPLFEELERQGSSKEFVLKKLAYSYFSTSKLAAADSTYRKLAQFPNSTGHAYYNIGHIFWAKKQMDSAKVYIKQAIEEEKVYLGNEYQALGRLYRVEGNLKESLHYYTKAFEEDRTKYLNYYQVCVIAEEYYADPKTRLRYYQNLLDWFPKLPPYFKEFAQKRIRLIKEEMHFAAGEER